MSEATDATHAPETKMPGRWWAAGALVLSVLVVGLDTYVLATVLPTLAAELGATTSELQRMSAAYTLV